MAKPTKWTDEAEEMFIEHLSKTGRMGHSAKHVGVSPTTARRHINERPYLKVRVDDAMEMYKESLCAEIFRRGVTGVEKPVYYQGAVVGVIKEYSDRLLELEARRHMPEYREKQSIRHDHRGGVLVVPSEPAKDESADAWADRANGVKDN